MRKKKTTAFLIGLSFVLAVSLIVEPVAFASKLNDLKQSQKELDQKEQNIKSQINTTKSNISANESKQESLLAQIKALDGKIIETNAKVEKTLKDIALTNVEIEQLTQSIAELEKKIADRDELLKERIRAVQASGGSVSYIDVLLGASSFADFIDRFSAVNTIMDADRKILKEQSDDKLALETNKKDIEKKLAEQEKRRDTLLALKNKMDSQKIAKNALVDALEAEQAKLYAAKDKLQEEYSDILEVSKEVEAKIIAEQRRIAELARQAELERKKREQANGGIPEVSGGTWTRPTNGRFTSGFGNRDFGGGEFHYGVDIANSTGTPIVAAAGGIVSYAAPLSTFGNVIMITHSVDGQIFTTVYAHLSSYNVSVNQVVDKGQVIGGMGSTGRSTGPHLHFEMHLGTWEGQKKNVVNPLRYISF